MNKNTKIVVWLVIVGIMLCVGLYLYKKDESTTITPPVASTQNSNNIKGCYVAKLSKDVYTIKIDSEDGGVVKGTLAYKNYEKDSSSGTLTGSFKDDILLGDYLFNSEGMQSNRQVIFKKVGNSFIQGFGEVAVEGDKEVFKDVSTVEYDQNLTFIKSESCS